MRFATALITTFTFATAVRIENEIDANTKAKVDADTKVTSNEDDFDIPFTPEFTPTINEQEEEISVAASYPGDHNHGSDPNYPGGDPYSGYFDIGKMHAQSDYELSAPENLPGGDFNKQVYEFDTNTNIWD